jgi:hypothetical protein
MVVAASNPTSETHAPHVHAAQRQLSRVDVKAVLEQDHEGQSDDAGHRGALEDQGQHGRDPYVLVGDDPTGHRADGEEDDRMYRAVVAQCGEQLGAEDGEPAHPRHRDEEVRPDKRPAGEDAGGGTEPFTGVGVHGAGEGGPLRELVQAEHDEEQHDRPEGIGQPRALTGAGEGERNDEHCRHGWRDQGDRLGEERG